MCDADARLDGKVAIVTGGSSGIGFEAAKDLAYRGARVIIASRNETKLKKARDDIQDATKNKNVDYRTIDLGSFKSVRNFVLDTVNSETRLDVLINNAGSVGLPDRPTEDGLNLTMQVNYFGAFLLTYLLLPLLKSSAPSRIINGSAATMYIGSIDFDHLNDIGRYNLVTSLANSKLAVTLFTAELDRRLKGTGVTANSYDPFVVRDTDILVNLPTIARPISRFFVNMIGQRKEEVGKQIGYIAANPDMGKVSGQHFKFCRNWLNHWSVGDVKLTERLWNVSKKIVKISDDEDWEVNSVPES